jgi:hypothetical protein
MSTTPRKGGFRAWNLLLLVPLIVLLTPLFNASEPRLIGVPFFYWFQIAVIPLGVACTVAVHLMTRTPDEEGTAGPDVDALDRSAVGDAPSSAAPTTGEGERS